MSLDCSTFKVVVVGPLRWLVPVRLFEEAFC